MEMYFDKLYVRLIKDVLGIDQLIAINVLSMPALKLLERVGGPGCISAQGPGFSVLDTQSVRNFSCHSLQSKVARS
jgi:hypothetical protein